MSGWKIVFEPEYFLKKSKDYKVVTLAYPYVEVSMRCSMTVAVST